MKNFISIFKSSAKELKTTTCITLSAMLGAISVVLGNFTISVTSYLKIGVVFVASRTIYYLFGPVVGSIFGAAIDILTYLVKPTGPFHPGFTLNAAISGLIFGLILYKKPLKLYRVFLASTINMIIVNIFLNTYWITTISGKSLLALLPARAIKNLVLLPVESIILYLVIKGIEASGVINRLSQKD